MGWYNSACWLSDKTLFLVTVKLAMCKEDETQDITRKNLVKVLHKMWPELIYYTRSTNARTLFQCETCYRKELLNQNTNITKNNSSLNRWAPLNLKTKKSVQQRKQSSEKTYSLQNGSKYFTVPNQKRG